jgi:ribosomal-protein-alanine N-acetyltransferase
MAKKHLTGKKVYLRSPAESDFAEQTAMAISSEKFHRNLIKMASTRKEFNEYLEKSEWEDNAFFLICQVSDDAIAGMINLSQIFYGNFCSAYLGYGLGVNFIHQGLMTESVALMVRHSFRELKLHRLEANVQPENAPSIAVLQRNGFRNEGISPRYLKVGGKWRDHERWAITREEWKPIQF